ncbi:MAG: PA0069 family radical SAM protein [Ancalomicrobiaceae bacterium]|nr:PA0069 family radical SAM protein [Ancalomicrobiaceae bacterium]
MASLRSTPSAAVKPTRTDAQPETGAAPGPEGLTDTVGIAPARRRGRGAASNASGRFEREARELVDDGWETGDELPPLKTEVQIEKPKKIITRNTSPDIPFDRSINPYRGCEHGCAYCFARPTHAYMGLSPGLDFETKLFIKPNAAVLLERELSEAGYEPKPIAIGTNTDPYQPIERRYKLMREILEVLDRASHPVTITTKSALVARDVDILARLASRGLTKVAISITSLDAKIARAMEPRASAPAKRLEALKLLAAAGVPVGVMIAPVVPAINDAEIERILEAAAEAGATSANYILLRLPLEVSQLFKEWLTEHFPDRYRHVMSILRSMRDGKDYDSEWGVRMKGTGPYAEQLRQRVALATRRLGLNRRIHLETGLFVPPRPGLRQLSLF